MVSKEEIIEMAREAGLRDCTCAGTKGCLERFAALVADAEAKRIYDEGMVTVGHMREQIAAEQKKWQDQAMVDIHDAVLEEREAMVAEAAKQGWAMKNEDPFEDAVHEIAAIRARIQ